MWGQPMAWVTGSRSSNGERGTGFELLLEHDRRTGMHGRQQGPDQPSTQNSGIGV